MNDDTENWLVYTKYSRNPRHLPPFNDLYRQYNTDSFLQQELYHYTKLKLLKLILCKWQFMMTRWDQMRNDSSEGLFLYSVYKKVCNSLKEEMSDSFFTLLSSISAPETFRKAFWIKSQCVVENCIPYVACFSMSKCSYKMRANYSSDVTLELFANSFPYYGKKPSNDPFNIETVKVRYGEEEVSKILEKAIRTLMDSNESPLYCKEVMEELLSFMRMAVKKEVFAYENEIRKILYVPINLEKYPLLKNTLCDPYYEYDYNDCIIERKGPFGKDGNCIFVPFEPGPMQRIIISDDLSPEYVKEMLRSEKITPTITKDSQIVKQKSNRDYNNDNKMFR